MGHVTMENRHGLAVAGMLSKATGTAERRASEAMLAIRRKLARRRITVGENKAYDTADHLAKLRAAGITPHVTQNNGPTKTGWQRRSAIDGRTIRHGSYAASQSRRPMIECIFGWGKQHGTMRKTKHRGIRRVKAALSAQPHRLQSGPHPKASGSVMPRLQDTPSRCSKNAPARKPPPPRSPDISRQASGFSADC